MEEGGGVRGWKGGLGEVTEGGGGAERGEPSGGFCGLWGW